MLLPVPGSPFPRPEVDNKKARSANRSHPTLENRRKNSVPLHERGGR
ncbi:hypothetical protein CKA32_003888 [Geitlerinema sp. FC II]|nr:hypothetical protein CKA32_003888 [Geitlerinema sp. FC II]